MIETNKVQQVGDKLIFSIPNMDKMLENVDLNFLNFEHNHFLPQKFVEELVEKTGYQIVDKFYYLEHSVFYACAKASDSNKATEIQLKNAYDETEFEKYFLKLDFYVTEINQALNQSKLPSYIFGGHIFTQILLAAGVKEEMLKGCLDNSQFKIGKRLYGTNLMVRSPIEVLKESKKILVVGAVAQYKDEILDQFKSLGFEMSNIILFGGKNAR
jgi:hypothetical protein